MNLLYKSLQLSTICGQAQFSLLFHASLECSESGVQALLSAGADPSLRSPGAGSTVLQLMMKRDQTAMAQACLDRLPEASRRGFVNSCSNNGNIP